MLSNLFTLLDRLVLMGYICPPCRTDSAARMSARRKRAWIPCVHAPHILPETEAYDELVSSTTSLITTLTDADSNPVSLEDIIIMPGPQRSVEASPPQHLVMRFMTNPLN